MIERSKAFEKVIKIASAVRKLIILGDKSFTETEIRPILYDNFVEVFRTEGESIGKPFPRPKTTGKPWEKYRRYSLPGTLNRWQLGIWTGGTAYSVLNITQTDNARTTLSTGRGLVRMTIRYNKHANVSFGLDNKAVEEIKKAVADRIAKKLKEALS